MVRAKCTKNPPFHSTVYVCVCARARVDVCAQESSKARLVTGLIFLATKDCPLPHLLIYIPRHHAGSMCFDDDSEEDSSEGSGEVETFVSKTSSSSKGFAFLIDSVFRIFTKYLPIESVSTGDNTSSLPPKGGKENTKYVHNLRFYQSPKFSPVMTLVLPSPFCALRTAPTGDEDEDEFDFSGSQLQRTVCMHHSVFGAGNLLLL